jgi:hypothetical protein
MGHDEPVDRWSDARGHTIAAARSVLEQERQVSQSRSRLTRRALKCACTGAVTSGLFLLAACSTNSQGPSSSKTPSSTTSTQSALGTTTTAPVTPVAPQPSADVAANAFINFWASGDKPDALRVATAQAVNTLFAVPYPGGDLAIDRGCSTGASPVTCTFGPPGGADPNDAIYSLSVTELPNGYWYVSSAQMEG